MFEKFKVLLKHYWPEVSTFGPVWLPVSAWRWQESKKNKSAREKLWSSVYPSIAKTKLYLLSLLQEKYNYFFGYFWYEKRRGQMFKSQNQNVTYPIRVLQFLDSLI